MPVALPTEVIVALDGMLRKISPKTNAIQVCPNTVRHGSCADEHETEIERPERGARCLREIA